MTRLQELDEQIKKYVDKGIPATYIARVLDLKPREIMLIANIRNFYKTIEKEEGQMGLIRIAKIKEEIKKLVDKKIPKKLISSILEVDEYTVKMLLDDIRYYKEIKEEQTENNNSINSKE